MNPRALLPATLLGLLLASSPFPARAAGPSPDSELIWFDAPAAQFTDACPLGNGRLGATIYGGVTDERVVLNETGMWSGRPQDADRPDAAKALPEIRRLLLEGKNYQAEQLVNASFTCAGKGSGFGAGANDPYGCYQVLGNLRIHFTQPGAADKVRDYRRQLDLADAIARVSYEQDGVRYSREAFVSAPDQVIVLRLAANRPGSISFDARLTRPERATTAADGRDGLKMTGQLNNGTNGKGVRFAANLRAIAHGGTVRTAGDVLEVRGADDVLLLVTAMTDIHTFAGLHSDHPERAATAGMAKAAAKSYAALLRAHVADYRQWYDRVSLHLGPTNPVTAGLPTPARLQAFETDGHNDPGLAALYFNFGRYLLISSSRPGGLPANLQGLWADQIQTPWNGDWHLNVNVEMNYWPAEVCDLGPLTQPLFALIASLQKPGAKTAKDYYDAHGWVAHVITNPWGFTSPGESATWGSTTTGSAWLCQHLWDHYLFTQNRQFLAWAYPIMKGSAEFYLDMLIEDPANHWLVTAPSNSPENSFYLPDGRICHICLGSTFDMQVLRYLFGACIDASRILGVDPAFRHELIAKRARLAPTRIGPDGRVMEWLEPYREVDPHHRHVSHLWGLYPGDEIGPYSTPALAAAARKTLIVRGDGGTGWSLAFKECLWARLGDGNHAYLLLCNQLRPALPNTEANHFTGGTYPDLLNSGPPFQIDGNFGTTAAIAEMLLQSTPGEIDLLPALPAAWPDGRVIGLRARDGFAVDLAWHGGKLESARIRSVVGTKTRVRYGSRVVDLALPPGGAVTLDGALQPE